MKNFIVFTIFCLVFGMFGFMPVPVANAGSITMYLDLVPDTNYNGVGDISPSTITTRPEIALSSTDEVFFSWDADSEFATSDTITFTLPATYTAAACAVAGATVDADGDGLNDGSFGFVGNVATYTFTAATTQGVTGLEFCMEVATDGTAGNEFVYMTDSRSSGDYGGGLIYNGDANDVYVTANLGLSLTFEIRNTGDTALETTCALGTLTTTGVNTCDYRLKVATNADAGYDIYINSDGDLRRSGTGDVGDADDIDLVGEALVTAGTEGYGIAFVAQSTTGGGSCTAQGNFTSDDSSVPYSSEPIPQILDCTSPNAPGASGDTTYTSLVTHKAAADGNTQPGSYAHTVSYYLIASF